MFMSIWCVKDKVRSLILKNISVLQCFLSNLFIQRFFKTKSKTGNLQACLVKVSSRKSIIFSAKKRSLLL